MPDDSQWAVPVISIAADRAVFFAKDFDNDIHKSLKEGTEPLFEQDENEIHQWAVNNMKWVDVRVNAKCVNEPVCDYQKGWFHGAFEIR